MEEKAFALFFYVLNNQLTKNYDKIYYYLTRYAIIETLYAFNNFRKEVNSMKLIWNLKTMLIAVMILLCISIIGISVLTNNTKGSEDKIAGADQDYTDELEDYTDANDETGYSDEAEQADDSYEAYEDAASSDFTDLLSQLYTAMKEEDYETAANILASQEFGDGYWLNEAVMPFCFDGSEAYRSLDGTGMLVGLESQDPLKNSYRNVYFGNLSQGVSEGEGIFLAAVTVHDAISSITSVRYELYEGSWKNGKPNGAGVFTYVNDPLNGEKEGYVEKKVTGQFADGLADGGFTHVTTRDDKPVTTYCFTANNGELVADGKNVTWDEYSESYIIQGNASEEGDYSIAIKGDTPIGLSFFSEGQLIDYRVFD